jgi:hypothetical protein
MKRIFACFFILAAFPLLASLTHNESANSAPFATVAFAGHVTSGGAYCECGSSLDCICDPGEQAGGQRNRAVSGKSDDSMNQVVSPADERPGFDFGSSALLLALAVFVWTRLRA